MAAQIMFFRKNIIDISLDNVVMTVTDSVADNNGQDIIDFVRNRNNYSAWLTTGSEDSANTQIDVEFGEGRDLADILLIKHNWKAFTIQYWNSTTYVDFSTPINETNCTAETSHFEFTPVETSKIRIIITGTQVADADKELYQMILTEQFGQLEGWPLIKNPTHDRSRKVSTMLSGRVNVQESLGAFFVDLEVTNWKNQADLEIIEAVYQRREGVLLWICGGDEDQFALNLMGYRKEDVYLVRPINNYEPEFAKNYTSGVKIKIQLKEAID